MDKFEKTATAIIGFSLGGIAILVAYNIWLTRQIENQAERAGDLIRKRNAEAIDKALGGNWEHHFG